ncbi:MAG: ABC transporter ATP-binding protein [Proteobacteria bacterium]|nr:ABC transporter ATP-binding protein [Pseudomonadota bacterium]
MNKYVLMNATASDNTMKLKNANKENEVIEEKLDKSACNFKKPVLQLLLNNITIKLGRQIILDNINLHFQGAQVVTLLGPNGAGKSTLLKVVSALLCATTGKVVLNKIDAKLARLQYLSKIGYMPEYAVILAELTVQEQLQLHAELKNVSHSKQQIQKVISVCQLDTVIHKRTNHLSLGYRQRLNLAQALLNNPQVLIMDEPLNGLDPHLIIEFRNIIKQLQNDTLVIMSTHYLTEAQMISDRVLIMQDGRVLDNIEMNDNTNLEQLYLGLL